MLIPIDFGQANMIFTGQAAPTGAEVTVGFSHDLFAGTASEAAVQFKNKWVLRIIGNQASSITLARVDVKFGPNDLGPQGSAPAGVNGGDTNSADPPNIALLVKKSTGVGGRSGRGRMFVPGMTSTLFDSSGNVAADRISTLDLAFENFRTDMATLGLPLHLLHGPASPVSVPYPIVNLSIDARGATQRRRLRR